MILRSNISASSDVKKIKKKVIKNSSLFTDGILRNSINKVRVLKEFEVSDSNEVINKSQLAFVIKNGIDLLILNRFTDKIYTYNNGRLYPTIFCVDGHITDRILYDYLHLVPHSLLEEVDIYSFSIDRYRQNIKGGN